MTWNEEWNIFALIIAIGAVILALIAGCLMNDYYIAHSATPIETACALGRKDVCLMMVRP